MKLSQKWISLGTRLIFAAFDHADEVERLGKAIKLPGTDKEAAVVALTREIVEAGEEVANRDLLNDTEVEMALRSALQAYVHFQNVVAAKAKAST